MSLLNLCVGPNCVPAMGLISGLFAVAQIPFSLLALIDPTGDYLAIPFLIGLIGTLISNFGF